ncbi:nitroreductase family protein [Massilia sp. MS-15]|uniref:nitroreductase family protein n=1 Tax=Massilia sp. MS-15 TaxID=2878200 RepID=UPI001CD4663E|nr:nitroreductase family protein [Massilia sp. MS-15]MCA1248196.1 nitroreductase family protein [Massilia sp. MS-15]
MMDKLWSCLAGRRHVSLRRLLAPGPDDAALERIFAAAAQAPDHGVLLPWRFILVSQERRPDLGRAFAEALAQRDPGADEAARAAAYEKAFHAPCLVAAVMVDDPAGATTVPVTEKLVSLGCAVQNMLLAAQAQGFASGLASGLAMESAAMRRLLYLLPHEQAICFIGFGTGGAAKAPRERPATGRFVTVL